MITFKEEVDECFEINLDDRVWWITESSGS